MPGIDSHQYDEDGSYVPENYEQCIEEQHVMSCSCACGTHCEQLITRVSLRDAERESRIAEKGSPLYYIVDDGR